MDGRVDDEVREGGRAVNVHALIPSASTPTVNSRLQSAGGGQSTNHAET
jgi:hypothetical protein